MSKHDEIFAALTDAIASHNREPELLAQIKQLTEELELTKMLLADENAENVKLREIVANKSTAIDTHRKTIDIHEDQILRLTDTVAELEQDKRHDKLVITDLNNAVDAKDQQITILRADKVALEVKLNDSQTFGAKLKSTLARIMGEAKDVVEPALEVAADATFQSVDKPAEVVEPIVEPVAEPVSKASTWNFN